MLPWLHGPQDSLKCRYAATYRTKRLHIPCIHSHKQLLLTDLTTLSAHVLTAFFMLLQPSAIFWMPASTTAHLRCNLLTHRYPLKNSALFIYTFLYTHVYLSSSSFAYKQQCLGKAKYFMCIFFSLQSSVKEEKTLTLRSLTLYIYGAPILDVSRSHTTTQHSR